MASNDEIKKKLSEKRKGLDSDVLYCPECGVENLKTSAFCKNCGTKFEDIIVKKEENVIKKSDFPEKHPKLAKIPGFRSGVGWKMVLGSVGYFLLALIIVVGLLNVLINADVTTNVNSALYTTDIAGNSINNNLSSYDSDNNKKFLLMNVSVKNNGNGKVTINPSDFIILTKNKTSNSNLYIGNTSISSIEVAPGENKSMIIAFIIPKNSTPDSLKYINFWDMGSNGVTANIGKIANKTPIYDQYSLYSEKGEYKWSGGSKSVERTMNVTYNYLNVPFTTSYNDLITYSINGSSYSFTFTENQSIKETTIRTVTKGESSFDVLSGTLTIPTGKTTETLSTSLRNKKGVYMSLVILNPMLDYIGSNVTVVDSNGNDVGSREVIRSEVIEVMGQKFDCWVIEDNSTEDSIATCYYDKTTGLLLKEIIKTEKIDGYDITYNGVNVLTSTNVPLVGLKT